MTAAGWVVLVGRQAEIEALDAVLAAAVCRRADAVLITGDVGMGKTTLLDAVEEHAQARGFLVLRVAASPGCGQESWAVLRRLLRPLQEPSCTVGADTDEALGRLCLDHDGAPPSIPEVARAVGLAVASCAEAQPVLLLVDDLQWADEQTMAVLSLATATWPPRARVAVVAASRGRSVDSRLGHWRVLQLQPLGLGDAVVLLASVCRVPLSPRRAKQVATRLGCCPLALVECDRVLRPDELAGTAPWPEPLPLHEHLRLAWCTDVMQLPERSRRALEVVCALATSRLDLLAAVLRADGLDLHDLEPATKAGLLRWTEPSSVDGAPATVGPLLISAVRGRMTRAERCRLHGVAAASAQSLGLPASVVVRHLREAASPGDEDVALALDGAARRARDHDLPGVAVAGWQAAAGTTLRPGARRSYALKAARTWLTELTSADGADELRRMLAGLDLGPDDMVWREWLRAEALSSESLAASAGALADAAAHASVAQPSLVPHLLWAATVTAWLAGVPRLGLQTARDLEEWLRLHSTSEVLPRWGGPAVLGTARLQAGDVAAGAGLVLAAREQAERCPPAPDLPLSRLMTVVAVDDVLLLGGEDPDQRLDELARRLAGDTAAAQAGVRVTQAWRARRRGDWTAAAVRLEEGEALARSVRAAAQELSALALATELDALTGAPTFAEHRDQLLSRVRAVGDRLGAAYGDRAAGLAALADGRPTDAVPHLESAAASACLGRGIADAPLGARVDLVEALCQLGDDREAHRRLDDLGRVLEHHPDPAAASALHRCRAVVARDDGDEEFQRALEAPPSGIDPFERARTRLLLGEHLRRTRRPVQARRELRAAAAGLRSLGAGPWMERANRELRAAGATGGRRPQGGEGWDRLTEQERRVATVVAEGASTREAAEALVLSPRTIEFHLANAYRKLGVSNRAGLAQAVRAV